MKSILKAAIGVMFMVLLLIGAVVLFLLNIGGIADAISFMMAMGCIVPPLMLIKDKEERR